MSLTGNTAGAGQLAAASAAPSEPMEKELDVMSEAPADPSPPAELPKPEAPPAPLPLPPSGESAAVDAATLAAAAVAAADAAAATSGGTVPTLGPAGTSRYAPKRRAVPWYLATTARSSALSANAGPGTAPSRTPRTRAADRWAASSRSAAMPARRPSHASSASSLGGGATLWCSIASRA